MDPAPSAPTPSRPRATARPTAGPESSRSGPTPRTPRGWPTRWCTSAPVPGRQRAGRLVARERLGQIVDDQRGAPRHLVDVPARDRDDERTAGVLGRRVVVEGEVAEAIVDVGRAQVAASEQHVGVGAHHDVCAGLHQHLGQRLLQRVGARIELGAPVEVDDHGVGRLARRLHRGDEVVHVVGGRQAGLRRGRRPRRLQVGVDDLGRRDDRDALSVDRRGVGGVGLRRVLADAEDRVTRLGPGGERRLQAGRAAVLSVVVGFGDQRHAGALERGHHGRRRVEDVLLRLRVRAGAVGQRRLVVDHRQVGTREQLGHRRPQGVGRVGGQPVARGWSRPGSGRHPRRRRSRTARHPASPDRGGGSPPGAVVTRDGGPPRRGSARRPRDAPAAGRHQDEGEGERHQAHDPEAPIALDPPGGQSGRPRRPARPRRRCRRSLGSGAREQIGRGRADSSRHGAGRGPGASVPRAACRDRRTRR